MQRKTVFLTYVLVLLLTCIGLNVQFIRLGKANETIYIRIDGSIDPPTSAIQRDGNVYIFTDNIHDSIVIERDNIVVEGAGYTVQFQYGAGTVGIDLSDRRNVTIKNMKIKAFCYGIELSYSSNNNIQSNDIIESSWGAVYCYYSSNNTFAGNNITNNYGDGIEFDNSNNNRICENNITGNCALPGSLQANGIYLFGSSYNSIYENNLANNQGRGIFFMGVSNNAIYGNNITNNSIGIGLEFSSTRNTIYGNTIINNDLGISMGGVIFASGYKECPEENKIYRNNVANNREVGVCFSGCLNNIFYHNNFLNNTSQIRSGNLSTNVWNNDYPSGGNYWSDHNPPDADMDKIGDLPYTLDENNTDRYPLIYPFECYLLGFTPSPDLNSDGIVNIVDIATVAIAFGCKPGDLHWDPKVDMDLNEAINILDLAAVAMDYGKTV